MGKYINEDSKGKAFSLHNKAQMLVADGATVIDVPEKFEEDLVCVVDNGPFQAAAYAFDQKEMDLFKQPDGRIKVWLKYKHAKSLAK